MEEKNGKVYYGFYVVTAMFFLMLPASLIMSAASIFYTPVAQELGIPIAAYGVNLTIVQLGCAVLVPTLFSKICRTFNMRYVLVVSLLVEAVCFAVRALATNIWVFYISSVIIAFPMGIFFNLSIQILMNIWFPLNAGTTIGIIGCAQGLGGMLFSTLGGYIIQNYSWQTCFWVWAVFCIVLVPVAFFIIRANPAEKGLLPFGIKKGETAADPGAAIELPGLSAAKARRTLPFVLFAIIYPLSAFIGNFSFYINAYCRNIGLSIVVAGAIAGIIQGGTMFYKLTIGIVSDKTMKGGMFYYIISTILCFGLFLIGGANTALIVISCFLFGGIYAATNLYGPVVVKYFFGMKDFAKIWPTIVGCFTLLGAFGSTIWGVIVEATSYQTGFLIAFILSVLLLVLYLIAFSLHKKTTTLWAAEK
jgi:predicted MFS family arabinose efflux permease